MPGAMTGMVYMKSIIAVLAGAVRSNESVN